MQRNPYLVALSADLMTSQGRIEHTCAVWHTFTMHCPPSSLLIPPPAVLSCHIDSAHVSSEARVRGAAAVGKACR